MPTSTRVRRYQAYRAMPWRNGRGTTLEIAREPALGESFAWRLSLADIDRDSEFSAYPGYRRALVLVAGSSLRLTFEGNGDRFLDPKRRGARFEGDWNTHCAVPQGRCTDLSLIVWKGSAARPAAIVRAPRMLRVKSTVRAVLPGYLYGALFVLEGSAAVTTAIRARPHTIRARDTLLLAPRPKRTLKLRNVGQGAARLVLLCWRPGRKPKLRG